MEPDAAVAVALQPAASKQQSVAWTTTPRVPRDERDRRSWGSPPLYRPEHFEARRKKSARFPAPEVSTLDKNRLDDTSGL